MNVQDYKFKAKSPITQKWVYGNLFVRSEAQLSFGASAQAFIMSNDGHSYEVAPETVGFFSGRTDDRGTDIYGGDIIKESYPDGSFFVYRVEFAESAFLAVDTKRGRKSPLREVGKFGMAKVSVIGNINDSVVAVRNVSDYEYEEEEE